MNLKSFISLAISLGLTLSCTGCSNTQKSTAKNNNNSSVSFTTKENKDDSTKETYPKPDWETQIYKGKYLKYEIPKNWSKNEAHSIEEMNLDFFTPTDTTSEMPSNINIQISSLQSNSKNIDYSDEKIKEDFHKFLLSSGQLPEEAQSGKYFTEEINGIWVYYLTFDREIQDGLSAKQTIYLPMGLDYSIIIWATDFNDGSTPKVDDIAKYICATLEII